MLPYVKMQLYRKVWYSYKNRYNKTKERNESMFGKNIKVTDDLTDAAENGTYAENDTERRNAVIERIMQFTGAKNLDELEKIVGFAADAERNDAAENDDKLFNAINSVKNNHSLLEAKEMEKNEDFVNAVLAGFDPEKAYMLARCEELISEAYAEGEEHGKAAVKAREDRIGEVGMTVSGGYKAEIDPNKMTMGDLKKIKERLRKGENVRL